MPRRFPQKTVDKNLKEYSERRRAVDVEAARAKIEVDRIIKRLNDAALGKIKLSPSEIKCMELGLDKTMPDLASLKHDVEVKNVTFVIETDYRPQSV